MSFQGIDFKSIIERVKQAELEGLQQRLEQFGAEDPGMNDRCFRCNEKLGEHYGASFLYCPDQWVAEGHQLSRY